MSFEKKPEELTEQELLDELRWFAAADWLGDDLCELDKARREAIKIESKRRTTPEDEEATRKLLAELEKLQ